MFGSRVVIPTKFQDRLLNELHETHAGIIKMKSLARQYVWWPTLNKDIESIKCKCVNRRRKPVSTSLSHWPWATRPMERIHIDFAEYKGVHLLVIIDVYSKYIWTFVMGTDTTTPKLLRCLDFVFADRGLPLTVVSDNGPQFTSKLFKEHMISVGVKHILTPPYHPASNGSAEKAVGIIKNHLYKMDAPSSLTGLQSTLNTVLAWYRNTPHTVTHRTPHELMKGYLPRTKFSLLQPNVNNDFAKQY